MRKKFRPGVVALTLIALAGCGGVPLPTYNDAFKGLYNQSAAAVPADVAVPIQHPIGIILSDNVEAYVGWERRSAEYWRSVVPASLTNTVGEADGDPNYIAARFLEMLKRHFPEAEVIRDFPSAIASGKKAVVVLDIQVVAAGRSGQLTTVDATTYFFDSRLNPVSKMSGHGEAVAPFPLTTAMIQPTTDAAVRQVDAKITALVR